jgi:hypothetical protein
MSTAYTKRLLFVKEIRGLGLFLGIDRECAEELCNRTNFVNVFHRKSSTYAKKSVENL